eukprot:s2661_g1.t1
MTGCLDPMLLSLMLGLETANGPKLVGLALGIAGAGLIVLLDPGVRQLARKHSALQVVAWTHVVALPMLVIFGVAGNQSVPFRAAACDGCASVTARLLCEWS